MQAERKIWSDERMDEFAVRTDVNFGDVRRGVKEVRREIKDLRLESNAKIEGLRTEMNLRFAGLDRRFNILIGAIVSGFVGLIISQFIG